MRRNNAGPIFRTHTLIRPATENQRAFVKNIKRNTITIADGVPGCGKTLLALHTAITMINAPENGLERIIYVRPNVGVKDERDVGYLKGSLLEKIWPLAAPVLDNLITFMSEGDAKAAIENEHIIPTVVSLIRGRSFRNSLIIVDEAQNISINGLKAVLTRVAENSKVVVIGDLGQADLGELSAPNGLADALHRFVGLDDVAITRFEPEDIQRHRIIQHVLSRY